MRLHEDPRLFRQAIQFTADQMQIPAIYVEKDYWITFALKTIFESEIGVDTVFKGGTALSKCYAMINRFSEDIDLVVFRREGDSNTKLATKIKTIGAAINAVLPEIRIEGLTHKMGMSRKTAHTYHKEFAGVYGEIRDVIIVEATWLGYFEPYTTRPINSFVGSMMLANGQEKITADLELTPFEVLVLEPVRTICEKIMSLVRFSYGEEPITDLRKKIRHIYDLHQLLQQTEYSNFLNSARFDQMLLRVGQDDVVSFKNNNRWLANHPKDALIFRDIEVIWKELRGAYNRDFRNIVYQELPTEAAIQQTLYEIKKRLETVVWSLTIAK